MTSLNKTQRLMYDTHQTNAYAMQGLLPRGVKQSSRNETCSYIINTTIGEQDHAGIVWKMSPAATKDSGAWRHRCCGARARRCRFLLQSERRLQAPEIARGYDRHRSERCQWRRQLRLPCNLSWEYARKGPTLRRCRWCWPCSSRRASQLANRPERWRQPNTRVGYFLLSG